MKALTTTSLSILLLACSLAFASLATADTLIWVLPTEYTGTGGPLAPEDIKNIKVYRSGTQASIATLPGTATSYGVPSCTAATYTVTAIATNNLDRKSVV